MSEISDPLDPWRLPALERFGEQLREAERADRPARARRPEHEAECVQPPDAIDTHGRQGGDPALASLIAWATRPRVWRAHRPSVRQPRFLTGYSLPEEHCAVARTSVELAPSQSIAPSQIRPSGIYSQGTAP